MPVTRGSGLHRSWPLRRLRFLLKTNPSRAELRGAPDDMEVSFVPMEDVGDDGVLRHSQIRRLSDVYTGYTYFREGDVVVAKITPCFENGKGAIATRLVNGIGFGTTELHVLRPGPELDRRFLLYLTISQPFRDAGTASMTGAAGQKRVPDSFIRDLVVGLPPLEEQRTIAEYLDEKTAAIDALMAKRERHIQLLEEERQAVIARIVTRGLGTDAGYYDSGLPWIGAVPQHWRVAELRRAWDVVDCKHRTPTYVEEGYPLVSTTEVKPGRLDLRQTTRFVGEADFADMTEGPRRPRRGDIIYSRNASLGSAAYVDTDEPFCMGQDVVLVTSEDQDQLFLSYILNSRIVGAQVERMSIGSTFNRINVSQIRSFIVPVPPREEQHAIATHLDVVSARIGKTVSCIREQIEKLREYRQTLISAAVSGQLPVREEVPA